MASTVQEYLGVPSSWKVKEKLKHEVVLLPNKRDLKGAKQKEPKACALRNAACRMFGVPNAAIGASKAYIPMRDTNGKHYIARMSAPKETREAIQKFDRTGEMPEGGFRFVPVATSQTCQRQRTNFKKWSAKQATNTTKKKAVRRKTTPTRSIPRSLAVA